MKYEKRFIRSLQVLLCLLLIQPTTASAKTTRATKVVVQNSTGLEIESITVVHKYSNVFKDRHTWGKLMNGQRTRAPMKVRYNTGFGTTGQDWWYVAWKYKGQKNIQYTAPNNFRNIIDKIETGVNKAIRTMGKMTGDPLILDKFARASTSAAGNVLFNNGSTNGLKKHFLKKKDQAKGLLITITLNSVKFSSASGKSSTEGIKTKLLKIPNKKPPIRNTIVQVATSCAKAVQDKIAWDYKDHKRWNQANIKSLCGNSKTAQPAVCFNQIMHRGVNWGGGTQWKYADAIDLCRQSSNAIATVNCFKKQVKNPRIDWKRAINLCKSKQLKIPNKKPPIRNTIVQVASSCAKAVQDKIAWDYKDHKRWNQANIKSLCGNSKTAQPAVCFNQVMHQGVNWGGGTQWKYINAIDLCRQSSNAIATVNCFKKQVKNPRIDWMRAINLCKSKQ